ncbi:MAG: hypothetical protein ACLFQ8_01230 [Candidatus Aenigmatarchaeota archaeon]
MGDFVNDYEEAAEVLRELLSDRPMQVTRLYETFVDEANSEIGKQTFNRAIEELKGKGEIKQYKWRELIEEYERVSDPPRGRKPAERVIVTSQEDEKELNKIMREYTRRKCRA